MVLIGTCALGLGFFNWFSKENKSLRCTWKIINSEDSLIHDQNGIKKEIRLSLINDDNIASIKHQDAWSNLEDQPVVKTFIRIKQTPHYHYEGVLPKYHTL